MRKLLSVISMLAALTLILSACAPAATQAPAAPAAPVVQTVVVEVTKPSATGSLIGYSAPELTGGQGAIMGGMVAGAKAQSWQVVTTNANSDASTQANQVESFISLGVKAIVAVPVDSKAICAEVQKAKDAGIPFFTIDRGTLGCPVAMTIQSDNYLGGKQAGEAMAALLKAKYGDYKGTVLELQGDLGQNVAQLRGAGFDDVMKQYPNVKIIQKPTNWDAAKFGSSTTDVASSTPLDGIYMHSDCVGTKPVTSALEALNKLVKSPDKNHIFIVGVDGCHDSLQAIRDGYEDEASSQPLPDDGVVIAGYMAQVLAGQTIQPGTVTKEGALWSPATIQQTDNGLVCNLATTQVTKDNVDNPGLWGNQ